MLALFALGQIRDHAPLGILGEVRETLGVGEHLREGGIEAAHAAVPERPGPFPEPEVQSPGGAARSR